MMCSFEERGNQIIDKVKRMGIRHTLNMTYTDRIQWVEHLVILSHPYTVSFTVLFPRIEMNVVYYRNQ